LAIHDILKKEIEKQIEKNNQLKQVGERLVKWLEELSDGNDNDRNNKDWINLILKDLKVKDNNED
jgi:hypothetical protein